MELGRANAIADAIARDAQANGLTIAVAESLTSGQVAARLGAASAASRWFAGGVTSYMTASKHRVLSLTPGPVVSVRAAEEMATGVATLFGVNLALSITGVGGPEEQDGVPVGTVFIGIRSPFGDVNVSEHLFEGNPQEIVESSVQMALRLLESRVHALGQLGDDRLPH